MKNGKVIKTTAEYKPEDELDLINSYARRTLSADEVYVFTVALCDNDIDRDCERFTVESLFALEKLFVGKTGIIDHDPTAKNQKARIISCSVDAVPGHKTALGDELFRLTARAYILRTPGNAELIEAIDAGIVKEVSVGCSIGHTLCSICRTDIGSSACSHVKGRKYGGELCYGELCEPKDAYEFSFVAIPAQRAAGVIKTLSKEKDMKDIKTAIEASDELTLGKTELKQLRDYIAELEQENESAKAYRNELVHKLSDSMKAKGIRLDYCASKSITDKLSISEIRALTDALADASGEMPQVQLYCPKSGADAGNIEFTI